MNFHLLLYIFKHEPKECYDIYFPDSTGTINTIYNQSIDIDNERDHSQFVSTLESYI